MFDSTPVNLNKNRGVNFLLTLYILYCTMYAIWVRIRVKSVRLAVLWGLLLDCCWPSVGGLSAEMRSMGDDLLASRELCVASSRAYSAHRWLRLRAPRPRARRHRLGHHTAFRGLARRALHRSPRRWRPHAPTFCQSTPHYSTLFFSRFLLFLFLSHFTLYSIRPVYLSNLLQSKEWIDTLAMNGSVESVAFSSDGTQLFSFGGMGILITRTVYRAAPHILVKVAIIFDSPRFYKILTENLFIYVNKIKINLLVVRWSLYTSRSYFKIFCIIKSEPITYFVNEWNSIDNANTHHFKIDPIPDSNVHDANLNIMLGSNIF